MRAKLEDKIVKAPTPGLKDKYRRSLEETTKAFEILMLSADGSSLPAAVTEGVGPLFVDLGDSAGAEIFMRCL